MKRTDLTNATILALALVASPVLAQTYSQGTTTDQTQTQSTTPGTTTESTTPSTTDPNATTPTTTTNSNDMSTTTTDTSQPLPATGSPTGAVIAVSLAAMALGAWLSRPQPRI